MGQKIDQNSYELGYDAGWSDGTSDGYTSGWQEATEEYEGRISKLKAEIITLEARVNAISRRF